MRHKASFRCRQRSRETQQREMEWKQWVSSNIKSSKIWNEAKKLNKIQTKNLCHLQVAGDLSQEVFLWCKGRDQAAVMEEWMGERKCSLGIQTTLWSSPLEKGKRRRGISKCGMISTSLYDPSIILKGKMERPEWASRLRGKLQRWRDWGYWEGHNGRKGSQRRKLF